MAQGNFSYKRGPATFQYNDRGSKADKDVTFWRTGEKAVPGVPPTLDKYLGQTATPGYDGTASILYLSFADANSVRTVGSGTEWWSQLWTDKGSGREDDYTVWTVRSEKIPEGFRCLSPCFFKKDRRVGRQPPSADEVRGQVLVKDSLLSYVSGSSLQLVWDDRGTKAKADVSLYLGPDGFGLFGFPNYDRPAPTSFYPVLDFGKGVPVPNNNFLYKRGPAKFQYNDTASGADKDLTVWRSSGDLAGSGIPSYLSKYLGQTPSPGYPSSQTILYFSSVDTNNVIEVGGGSEWWTHLWTDKGSGKGDDYTIWRIRSEKVPDDFQCLSPCFFKKDRDVGRQPPTADEVRGQVLVKTEFVTFVPGSKLQEVWNDHGTGAKDDVSLYSGPDGFGIFGFANYDPPPPSTNYPVLDLSKGGEVLAGPN